MSGRSVFMDPSAVLTPSEIELLSVFRERQAVLFGNVTRTLSEGASESFSVLEHLFRRALEANVEVGNFVIQVQDRRAWLGLRPTHRVVIRANGSSYDWPEPSLEASLASMVSSYPGQVREITLTDLIAAWFADRAIKHFQAGVRWVYDALTERGWVDRKMQSRLGLFQVFQYSLPDGINNRIRNYVNGSKKTHKSRSSLHSDQVDSILLQDLDRSLRRVNPKL